MQTKLNSAMVWSQYCTKAQIFWLALLFLWTCYVVRFTNKLRLNSTPAPNPEWEFFNHEMQEMVNALTNDSTVLGEDLWEEESSRFLQTVNHRTHIRHRKELKEALESDELLSKSFGFNGSQEEHARVMELLSQEVNCPSLRRVGGYGLEGRWICGYETFLHNKENCVVYSFSLNISKLSFELAFLEETPCRVHLFDPFLATNEIQALKNRFENFKHHNLTLAATEDVDYLFDELRPDLSYIQEKSIDQIMRNLGHPWVDLVKIDFNGEDFEKLKEMMTGVMKLERVYHRRLQLPFGQLSFQMNSNGDVARVVQLIVALMNRGFSVYHSEPNLRSDKPWENVFFSLIHVDRYSNFIIR